MSTHDNGVNRQASLKWRREREIRRIRQKKEDRMVAPLKRESLKRMWKREGGGGEVKHRGGWPLEMKEMVVERLREKVVFVVRVSFSNI